MRTYFPVVVKGHRPIPSAICAVCHGVGDKGDGPAASALNKPVADLTVLSTNNSGVYPHDYVKDAIAGKSRVVAHGTVDMPVWGEQFLALRPDWSSLRREAFTQERIDALTMHIESIQVE